MASAGLTRAEFTKWGSRSITTRARDQKDTPGGDRYSSPLPQPEAHERAQPASFRPCEGGGGRMVSLTSQRPALPRKESLSDG